MEINEKQQYWFITYSWMRYDGNRILDQTLHCGSIQEWINNALDQPENYMLLNQVEIDEDQYLTLKLKVGEIFRVNKTKNEAYRYDIL